MMHRAAPTPDPRYEWATVMEQADREALAARFGVADRILADFAERHPNTSDAYEALFWRALYKLDPNNATATPREAGTMLDADLASSPPVPHRGAAAALRRVASALERPAPAAVASTSTPPAPTASADKSRDEEVARLKDELAKANAELERIKKRLSQPNP
jgi:hypothetical protein